MKSTKGILPIVVAFVIALVGSILTYGWMTKQGSTQTVVKVDADAVKIAVAIDDLPWGTELKKEHIIFSPFLKESLPENYFTDPALLEGRIIISPLKQREPIIESRLAPTSVTTGGISAVLQPGKRALAVKGDKIIGLSGLIQPGNRVDVLVTWEDPRNKREITKIVLENIVVLATGTEMQKNDKGEENTAPVDVYTLEVTPEEGERLTLAATEGRLQFALRNIIDTETVYTRGVTISDALKSYSKKTSSSGKSIPVARTVQVIKGTNSKKVSF